MVDKDTTTFSYETWLGCPFILECAGSPVLSPALSSPLPFRLPELPMKLLSLGTRGSTLADMLAEEVTDK